MLGDQRMREPVRAKAVVIGASAGAIDALSATLPGLPADYPLPIFVVVHIPPDKESLLANIFALKCALKLQEAQDNLNELTNLLAGK